MGSKKITNSKQEVAASILGSFFLCEDFSDFKRVFRRVAEKYGLCKDKFSGFPITRKEFSKNQLDTGVDRCVVCGVEIPEGRQICPSCESFCERVIGVDGAATSLSV